MSKIVLDTNSLIQSIPPKVSTVRFGIAFLDGTNELCVSYPRAIWLIRMDNYIPEKMKYLLLVVFAAGILLGGPALHAQHSMGGNRVVEYSDGGYAGGWYLYGRS